jgi:hypothetical protein
MSAQGDLFEPVRLASDLSRSSALTALIWSSMAFFRLISLLYLACNSESVMPANEGSRAFRRAPRVRERIRATNFGPMLGSLSQWVSGILATSRMEGQRPPNSVRTACLTLGESSSSGKGSSSRNGAPRILWAGYQDAAEMCGG